MGTTIVILIGLLQSYVVAGQGCKDFRLFDGDNEVTDFNCTVFLTSSCRHGPSSFPNNLSQGVSVGKPRNFEVSVFRRNFTIPGTNEVILTSGATFTWQPPIESISRLHLKGFFLRQFLVGTGSTVCRLVDLQDVDLTTSTNFHFELELFPFKGDYYESHIAYLRSLPPPSDLEDDEGLVEYVVFTTPKAVYWDRTPVVYPSQWTTWIRVILHESLGIVEIRFGYPDKDSLANFTTFHVQLVEDQKNNAMFALNIPRDGTEGRYNFTKVPIGTYKVQVQPEDMFFNIHGKCQCWEVYRGSGNVCTTCRFSATGLFNFTSLVSTSTFSPTDITTESVSTSLVDRAVDSASVISGGTVAGILVPLILLAILTSLVLLFLNKKKKLCKDKKAEDGVNAKNENTNENNNQGKIAGHFISIMDINANDKDLTTPQIGRKSVMLLASEDHEYFTEAVERLASFLEVHCMCDVIFAPQQMPQIRKAANSYCWLSRQIDSADFVVIVTSEAALRLYLAFRKGNGYTKAALGPEGDMFTPGIQHICGKIANNEDVRNVVTVYFDHSSPGFRLPIAPLSSFIYHLPNHLPDFLHFIHDLDKTKMNLSQVNLPLQGNIKELKGGQEWLDAVQQAKMYEMKNPEWFELKFGKPAELYPSQTKPDYNKQESEDSGYTECRNSKELKRRLSSASNNAGDMDEEADLDMDNGSFIKKSFIPPSICTTATAYTLPYPGDDKPAEIDDKSLTIAFHRLNQQYEEEMQQQKHSFSEDSYVFNGPVYDPHTQPSDQHFISFAQEDEDHDCISVSSAQSV